MPKAKPSQVIVHRIELQQSERDAMEAALAGRFVTNAVGSLGSVLSGVGAFLTPFSGAIAAIATAMIAEKGIKAVIEDAKVVKEAAEDVKDWLDPSKQQEAYTYICSYLGALSGWRGDDNSYAAKIAGLQKDLKGMKAHPILMQRLQQFNSSVKKTISTEGKLPDMTPLQAWKSFYPTSRYIADMRATLGELTPDWLEALVGVDLPEVTR